MNRILVLSSLILIIALSTILLADFSTPYSRFEKIVPIKESLKKSGPEYFLEHQYSIRTRNGQDAPQYEAGYRNQELQKAIRANKNKIQTRETLPWIERGPGNVGGRTRGLIVDPRDSTHSTWYAGSVGGGVWKTEDAGKNWRNLTEELTNLGTSYLAMSPANPDVIYIGTGEGYGSRSITGNGIWRSQDSGETWTQLESTASDIRFGSVMRIVVNPENENELVVGTRVSFLEDEEVIGYILRSEDGGQSWREFYSSEQKITQVISAPSDFNVQYAAIENFGVIKSINGGRSWGTVFDLSEDLIGRVELAIAAENPDLVFLAAESFDNDFELFRSRDGGRNWNRIVSGDEFGFGFVFSGQGWYDNTIAIHPYDSNSVFVGGAGPIIKVTATNEVLGTFGISDIENNTNLLEIAEIPGAGTGALLVEDLADAFGEESTIEASEYVDIELRFGVRNSQQAHRFFFEDDDETATFESYGPIPFQAWDVENDQQLMVSYLDLDQDGQWTLVQDAEDLENLEVLVIHAIPYSDSLDVDISNSIVEKAMYAVFPYQTEPGIIDGSITIDVSVSQRRIGVLDVIVDGYFEYDDLFPFVGTKGVHVDHHNIITIPVDDINQEFYILNANDGGVAFSNDSGASFVQTGDTFKEDGYESFETTKGYNTAQFYGVDKMNGGSRYVGGTQDNGSWISDFDPEADSEWTAAPSGDGFEAAWHYSDSLKVLESSQFNTVFRSDDGGESWRRLNLPGRGPFLTRLANSKQDPDLVFALNRDGVLRSNDFGDSWEEISMPSQWEFFDFTAIEVSLASPSVVWTGSQMINNNRLTVSNDGGSSFRVTNNYEFAEMGAITGIATHPFEATTAYALFSMANGPKILKTKDLGETWEDISGFETNQEESSNGFPDVAVYSLVVMPYDTSIIWVGTEIGLFESTDAGESWHYADNGLPPVAIWEMKIVNDEVVLATHGRGIWSVSIPELENYVIPDALLAPRVEFNSDGFDGKLEGELNLRDSYDSSFVEVSFPGFEETTFRSDKIPSNPDPIVQLFNLTIENLVDDTILIADVRVVSYKDGIEVAGLTKVPVYDVENVVPPFYENDFDNGQSDFARLGFNQFQAANFSNQGLHSPHPYTGLNEYIAVLQIPVLVNADNSTLTYDEVVLVEIGDTEEFGSEDFYDFVVVEGTRDKGQTWEVLEGYDSSLRDIWRDVYNREGRGDEDLLLEHSINLLDVFDEGDLVYLRFRLVSDPFVEGWGWMIDNIRIGDPSVNTTNADLKALFDINVYPNPATDRVVINYNLPEAKLTRIDLFNTAGQKIANIDAAKQSSEGEHSVNYELNDLPSGLYFLQMKVGESLYVERLMVR